MANDTLNADELAKVQAAIDSIASSSTTVSETMGAVQTSVSSMNDYLETISGSMGSFSTISKELLTTMNSLSWAMDEIAEDQKDQLSVQRKILNEEKTALRIAGQRVKLRKQEVSTQKKLASQIGKHANEAKNFAKSSFAQVTGMSIGLGTIITLLVKAANNMRILSGMTRQAAMHFEGGLEQIGSARSAVMQLRKGFRQSYEEAGKVVTMLAQMGMSAKEIEGVHYKTRKWTGDRIKLTADLVKYDKMEKNAALDSLRIQDKMSKDQARMTDEEFAHYKGLALEREADAKSAAEDAKRIIEEQKTTFEAAEKKRQRAFKTTYGAAQELYAIEKSYGISVQQSGLFVKKLEQDYGKLNEEARTMLGVAIKSATEIDNIGVQELIDDWQRLIAQAQTYKTDVMGIIALYNTMMRSEEKMGLKGVPISVKKSIVETVTAWKASLDLGLKARLGAPSAGGPAARALEFEEAGYAEQLKRFMEFARSQVDVTKKAVATVKVRELAKLYEFPPDVQKWLADAVVEGKINNEKTTEQLKAYEEEKKRIAENEKIWREDRGTMIANAELTAKRLLTIQELIQRWAEDIAARYLRPILDWLSEVYFAISKLWKSDEDIAQAEHLKKLREQFGPAVSLRLYTKMGEAFGKKIKTGLESPEVSTIRAIGTQYAPGAERTKRLLEAAMGAGLSFVSGGALGTSVEETKGQMVGLAKQKYFEKMIGNVAASAHYGERFRRAMEKGLMDRAVMIMEEYHRFGGKAPRRSKGKGVTGGVVKRGSGVQSVGGGARVEWSVSEGYQ